MEVFCYSVIILDIKQDIINWKVFNFFMQLVVLKL